MLIGFYIDPSPVRKSSFERNISKNVGLRSVTDDSPEGSLQAFYSLLSCNTIDIVSRVLFGTPVSIVVDDNGLFAESPLPSLVDYDGTPDDLPVDPLEILVGKIFICGPADDEGNLTDIPADVVANLCACVRGYVRGGLVSPLCVAYTQPLRGV